MTRMTAEITTEVTTPRLEINLAKIASNANMLVDLYGVKGIGLMGVTKGVCGSPAIASVLVEQGISTLADSKLDNIKKMRDANIEARYILLRSPALSEVDSVIKFADISMNTELSVIKKLSDTANEQKKIHEIILMIEMGDLREGIMPDDLDEFIGQVIKLTGIKIVGIGANFACFGGVKPSQKSMADLSTLASVIESKFSLSLFYISGGNSANYHLFKQTENIGRINNLRIGESIYLGCETLESSPIPGLYTDAFTLVSEVIESKIKPSKPYGEIGKDAFGNFPQFKDLGHMNRAILSIGTQDVHVTGLTPKETIEIIGSSSDHTLINAMETDLTVGDEVTFNLTYGALLSLMTSPYVLKKYIES